ncbi:hypothetical protein FFLO_05994 [Filobasidium floriforme]|uniref:Uncharacterized protein n=1 Tax=Filobasidium floriforme TaxID=5210 RepID=A0A8K0JLE8_9TREE|nr:uncharacterized protein HD553DRAFT_322781 [Filobasidium floriforme]KAG7528699.1 hypothetical protein FFLO_05994 [Filobasidium floriforme]KAH8087275.1 hypothetical protein HD553DRAFT_322781 [Filobasidium floriforme]
MQSSRITVHLPTRDLRDAGLERTQQSSASEDRDIWADFTTLVEDEGTQQEPSIPDHTTSASHIPNDFISSAAQGSQDFAANKSFNPKSYEIASLIPATATGENDSMAACVGNPDADTSTVEITTSSYTGVSRHTAAQAPLRSIGTGFEAAPYIDQSFDSAVPAASDSSSAYLPLETTPATDITSVASKMYEHNAVELKRNCQSCGGDLFACKRGKPSDALKSEYQEQLLWIMRQLDLNPHTAEKWAIFSPRYHDHSALKIKNLLHRRTDAVNVTNFIFRCCQFILEEIHTDSCPYIRAQLRIHNYTDNTKAKRDLGRCYEAIRSLNLSSLTWGHRAGPRLSIETSKLLSDQAHTAYTISTSSDHFSERMSDERWGDLSKNPGKRSYGHMSTNTTSEATDTSKVVKTASVSEQQCGGKLLSCNFTKDREIAPLKEEHAKLLYWLLGTLDMSLKPNRQWHLFNKEYRSSQRSSIAALSSILDSSENQKLLSYFIVWCLKHISYVHHNGGCPYLAEICQAHDIRTSIRTPRNETCIDTTYEKLVILEEELWLKGPPPIGPRAQDYKMPPDGF